MKLRTKTTLTVLILTLFMFSALQIITYVTLEPNTHRIETQETIQKIEIAKNLIEYRTSDLEVKVSDYAFWDDTYEYVQNKNEEYILSNFVDSTFENLQLNCVVIVNNQIEVIYQQEYDLGASIKYDIDRETQEFLIDCPHIWNFQYKDNAISGLMLVENKPMMIATSPVLSSDKQGPIMGGMLFGKFLDNVELNRLNSIVDFNFTLSTTTDLEMNEQNIVQELLLSGQKNTLKEQNQSVIIGYSLIEDVHSNPSFMLTVYNERIIHQQSILMGNVFSLSTIGISVIIGLILLVLLEKEIVKPMRKLSEYVEEISLNPNYSVPKLSSTEEIDIVSNAVRDTLKRKIEGMLEVSRIVAHDLRNPLAGIRNATYYLKKKYSLLMDKDGQAMLKTIDDCVVYSDNIVQNLIDYSSEIKLYKVKTTPKKLVERTLSKFIKPNNIEIIDETSNEVLIAIDTPKMEQVITNLVTNSFDAMQSGGTLRITNKEMKKSIRIELIDTGVGMSKAVIEKLYTPFFTTKSKGLGIGLSICKRIIEAHEGKIEVESTEGKGTKFSIILPKTE